MCGPGRETNRAILAFDRERETTLTRTNVAPSNCSQAWIGVAGCRPVRVEEEEEEKEDDDNDNDDDDATRFVLQK